MNALAGGGTFLVFPALVVAGVAPITANERAFRVMVRNQLFRRVELAARRAYEELGALDAGSGWDAVEWEAALEEYFESYEDIGTGPDARGPDLLLITTGPERWTVRQIFDDPEGDHDWGIAAEVAKSTRVSKSIPSPSSPMRAKNFAGPSS